MELLRGDIESDDHGNQMLANILIHIDLSFGEIREQRGRKPGLTKVTEEVRRIPSD